MFLLATQERLYGMDYQPNKEPSVASTSGHCCPCVLAEGGQDATNSLPCLMLVAHACNPSYLEG
jgi:hypothetical protein